MKKQLVFISLCALSVSTKIIAGDLFPKEKKTFSLGAKTSGMAGDGDVLKSPKQVIKLNLTQLALRNISLQYEFGFHKNFSVALGGSYLLPKDIPSQLFAPSSNGSGYQLPRFGGWAVTPEIRFYPGKKVKHQAPHGFYLAPYFRYSKYNLNSDYVNIDSTSGAQQNYNVTASYAGFTAGLMIGSQWLIGKHFSIDWWIIGGGYGKAKFNIHAVSTDGSINMSPQEQADLRRDIQDNIGELGSFGNGEVTIETTNNSATATVTGLPMTSIRGFGLTLGFSF
ncbi:MAG: hypothetical protein K0R26_2521 [Bacteroidota bacterium]|jgi:hypothetical protein|nr:hypothetical protein [Bacteroidota bacterium]